MSASKTATEYSDIAEWLSEAYHAARQCYNLEVEKNGHVLCQSINRTFEVPLHSHDESVGSDNPELFLALVDFTAELDSVLSKHLETANVFKGTSTAIKNELSDTMFDIWREFIRKEIKDVDFLGIISDDKQMLQIIQRRLLSLDTSKMKQLWKGSGHFVLYQEGMQPQYHLGLFHVWMKFSQVLKTNKSLLPSAMMVLQ